MDTATPAERARAAREYGAVQPGIRLFLRQMYTDTQAWLRDHGVREVFLARGNRWAEGNQPQGVEWNGRVQERPLPTRSLSSWAVNLATAERFAHKWSEEHDNARYGMTSAAMVPASRIFAIEQTGFGHAGEAEVVVLGGSDRAQTKAEHPITTIDQIDDARLYRQFGNAGQ